MVTENVNIAFRSTGIPVIKRQLDDLGVAANRATRGFFLLQRAMFTIGGFGLARSLTTSLDALTNMENRLRLTTSSAQELEAVQQELFDISRRSRMGWEGVAEIYNRTALSAKALGIAQGDVLRFTESVAKAANMSGATTQEANAALIQLGQAVASNRLGGDELRSILEQLPMVADIIANHMTKMGQWGTVTRGELRKLGSEGAITGQIIVDAFVDAGASIDAMFANYDPTIAQGFVAIKDEFMRILDAFDDATGFSAGFANALILIANNLDVIIMTAAGLAGAFAVGFAVNTITGFINGVRASVVEINALRAAKTLMAGADVAAAQRDLVANGLRQTQLTQNLALIGQKKALLLAEIAETEFVHKNNLARSIQTGRFVSLEGSKARLAQLTINLSRLEAVEAAQAGRLAGARAAQATATNALAGANGRLAAAQAAQAGTMATFMSRFPLMAGLVNMVRAAFTGLWAILVANPIGATIAIVIALIAAFWKWGNAIKVTADGVVGLKDFVIAAFQLMYEAIEPWITWFMDGFSTALTFVKDQFITFAGFIASVVWDAIKLIIDSLTFVPRVMVGVVTGIIAAWDVLPAAASQIGVDVANFLIAGFEMFANGAIKAINMVIEALNALLSFVGADKAAEWFGFSGQIGTIAEKTLPRMTSSYGAAGRTAADTFTAGFSEGFNSGTVDGMIKTATDALTPIGTAITDRARENIANAPPGTPAPGTGTGTGAGAGTGGGGKGGGGGNEKSFQDLINEMKQEISLLQMSNKERTIAQGLLEMEKTLKRGLTEEERNLATAMIQQLEAAKVQSELMESIVGPREKAIEQMTALNALFEAGKISIQEYNAELLNMSNALNGATQTLMGGFKNAIGSAILSANDFGKAMGNEVVGFVNDAADAIVKFAQTGKINIKELFATLFANLLKLAAQQLLLRFLGSILGIPGGGMGFGTSIGGGGLVGMAGGGSILPNGPGSTDSQIVAFKKRPDERVDVLTPGQQASQRNNGGGQNGQTIVQSPPVNVAAVISPNDIVGAFDQAGETVLVSMITRNASTIRKVIGG